MYISSIIKKSSSNERDAAIALERAIIGVGRISRSVLVDVKSGVERASWYSSCLFDKYEDICSELKGEDVRFTLSIYEIYKRRDVIADIMQMYFEDELKRENNEGIRSIDIKLTKLLMGYSGGKLTKTMMAYSLSMLVTNSYRFKNDILMRVNKGTLVIVTAASYYGKVQEAALAARRLRQLSPTLYQTLYANNIEMLYYFVSKSIDKAIVNSIGLHGEDRFVAIIRALVH